MYDQETLEAIASRAYSQGVADAATVAEEKAAEEAAQVEARNAETRSILQGQYNELMSRKQFAQAIIVRDRIRKLDA